MYYYNIKINILLLKRNLEFTNSLLIRNKLLEEEFNYIVNNMFESTFDETMETTTLNNNEYNKLINMLNNNSNSNSNIKEECSICKENICNNKITLICKHSYHKECIYKWLTKYNVRCCECRDDVRNYIK